MVELKNRSQHFQENSDVEIEWNAGALGRGSQVKIQIARYIFQNNAVKFHNFFDIKTLTNSGTSQIRIPQHEGKGIR